MLRNVATANPIAWTVRMRRRIIAVSLKLHSTCALNYNPLHQHAYSTHCSQPTSYYGDEREFLRQSRPFFFYLSFILALWLCDVSKAVIKYNRLWRQWSQACSFLVLANKLFVVFSMGMPLAPQKKQNSSF